LQKDQNLEGVNMELIFGCPQYYIQGPGILSSSAKYLINLGVGKRSLVLVDKAVKTCTSAMFDSFDENKIPYQTVDFDNQIRLDRIIDLIMQLRGQDFDCIIGVGGGKTIDVAKRIGWALKIKIIAVPTSIATDAATSRTAVAYGLENEIVEDKSLNNPDCVIVDSSVIVQAPIRLFNAGMADALSKRYEYLLSIKCNEKNWYDGDPAFFIDHISTDMHLLLLRNGRYLKDCFAKHELNDSVEQAITAMLLMSRIVWDAGGLRGAHDMFEEFHDAGYGNNCLHGEIVGYFDLIQLLLEEYPENEFEELYGLYKELQIPLKISLMDFPVNDKKALDNLVHRLINKCKKFNYHIHPDKLSEAILKLERRNIELRSL
jgi:glycerol dehydrogenase